MINDYHPKIGDNIVFDGYDVKVVGIYEDETMVRVIGTKEGNPFFGRIKTNKIGISDIVIIGQQDAMVFLRSRI